MLNKSIGFWETVVWSDESKFNLFGSDGKVMVWQTRDEEYDPKCTVPTVKHGGGSVIVWGCCTRNGVGELYILNRTMDRFYYRDILEQHLLSSITKFKFGGEFLFMHDNDPKHTSGLVKNWLEEEKIQVLPWPSFSPDLNPIEHLWDELERRLERHQPKNTQELENLLKQEWNNIDPNVLHKLVDSVPSRLCECTQMKGYPTRY